MSLKIDWGKPKIDLTSYSPSEEESTFLYQRNWVRIGNDLWRNVDTTKEMDTKQALETERLFEILDKDLDIALSSFVTHNKSIGESPLVQVDELTEPTELKPAISFPSEIRQQLKKQFAFITGQAGSGKSTLLRLEDELDPKYIEKGSTTGIAAINCGGRTINSLLRYYNTESLQRAYDFGKLHNKLRIIRERKRILGIDEVSMMDAVQLDIIMAAIDEINEDVDKPGDLGLHLIGDYLQLPPVKADFAFKADSWKVFDENIIKLEKVWRQDNPDFLSAINAMREGNGKKAVPLLKSCGVRFEKNLISNFEGTTLIPNNKDVDSFNFKRLAEVNSPMIRITPEKRGVQAKEWDKEIPFEQRFKLDAYVMILRNDHENWQFVNGDCGIIKDYNKTTNTFLIELKRNNSLVQVGFVKQLNLQDEQPNENLFNSMFYPYEDRISGQWVIGTILWIPLRLAYASTIHKAQGLTLDILQIDSRPQFYGFPSMSYVAISRARNPDNLIIVGDENDFAAKVKTDPVVRRFI